MHLKEWLIKFVEYKASFRNQTSQITEEEGLVKVVNSSQRTNYLVCEDLKNFDASLNADVCACLNTKSNVLFLHDNWDEFISLNTSFLFVNPKTKEHWSIKPKFHNVIAERKELKTGLLSLMEGVTVYD